MNRKFMAGLICFLVILVTGLIISLANPDPNKIVGDPFESPSLEHILGTDVVGKDIMAMAGHGIITSLIIGFIAGAIATALGVTVGLISGFYAGLPKKWLLSEALNVVSNVFLVIPLLALLIALSAFLEVRGIFLVGLVIGLASWAWVARSVRSQALSLKTREFMDLARVHALKDRELIFKEILPNMFSYVVLIFMITFGSAIIAEAGISMIGLGPTDAVSLGSILHASIINEAHRMGIWWWFIPPGLIIPLLSSSLLLIHMGMDEFFNPRLRRR